MLLRYIFSRTVQRVFIVFLDSGHSGMTKNLDDDEDGFDEGFSQLPYIRPFCLQYKNAFPSHLL
jgi:hypothetical protein